MLASVFGSGILQARGCVCLVVSILTQLNKQLPHLRLVVLRQPGKDNNEVVAIVQLPTKVEQFQEALVVAGKCPEIGFLDLWIVWCFLQFV